MANSTARECWDTSEAGRSYWRECKLYKNNVTLHDHISHTLEPPSNQKRLSEFFAQLAKDTYNWYDAADSQLVAEVGEAPYIQTMGDTLEKRRKIAEAIEDYVTPLPISLETSASMPALPTDEHVRKSFLGHAAGVDRAINRATTLLRGVEDLAFTQLGGLFVLRIAAKLYDALPQDVRENPMGPYHAFFGRGPTLKGIQGDKYERAAQRKDHFLEALALGNFARPPDAHDFLRQVNTHHDQMLTERVPNAEQFINQDTAMRMRDYAHRSPKAYQNFAAPFVMLHFLETRKSSAPRAVNAFDIRIGPAGKAFMEEVYAKTVLESGAPIFDEIIRLSKRS